MPLNLMCIPKDKVLLERLQRDSTNIHYLVFLLTLQKKVADEKRKRNKNI